MHLLMRTPSPRPHESLLGFALRVSEANGYDTPRHLCGLAGIGLAEFTAASFPDQKLARALGREESFLSRWSYHRLSNEGDREYQLHGHSLGKGMSQGLLRLMRPAICVQCIEEDGHIDACLDLSVFAACPRHGSVLTHCCGGCGKRLSWFRPGLLTCRCGADFRHEKPGEADFASIELMSVLSAKVRGERVSDLPNRAGLPISALADIALLPLIRLLQLLEREAMESDASGGSLQHASAAFADWPNGFFKYLDGIGKKTKGANLRERFPRLYGFMKHALEHDRPQLKFFKDALVRYGEEHCGDVFTDPRFRSDRSAGRRFKGLHHTARHFGVHTKTAKRWVEKGVLPLHTVQRRKLQRYIVDTQSADVLPRPREHSIKARKAGEYIGLPPSIFTQLRQAGQYSTNRVVNARAGYWPVDLDALAARINSASIACGNFDLSEAISLGDLMRFGKLGSPSAKSDLLIAVLEGRISPIGREGDSYLQLLFDKATIKSFRTSKIIAAFRKPLSTEVASCALGCSQEAIVSLIRAGHLKRKNGSGIGIDCSSIQEFQDKWFSTLKLTRLLKQSRYRIEEACAQAGIELMKIVNKKGTTSFFLSRADLQRLLRSLSADSGNAEELARLLE